MKVGDRVRMKGHPHKTFRIDREVDGNFGAIHTMSRMFGEGTLDVAVYYRPDELEVVE